MLRYTDALADFDRAIALNKHNHWAYERRGILLKDMEHYEEAVNSLTEADKIEPDCSTCIIYRGETYRLMGKYTDALADFDRAIALNKRNHWAYEERGILLKDMEHYEEAVNSLTEADKIEPDCSTCIIHRGETYRLMGKYTEALADFTMIIELDDQSQLAFRHRGETHLLMGKYAEALFDFDRAIALSAEPSATSLAWRGEMHRRLGSFEEAIKDLSLAIQLEPEADSFPRSRRAAVFKAIGDFVAASSDLARVKQFQGEEVSDLYNKAVVFSLSGQPDEAIDLLKHAIRKNSVARNYARNDDLFAKLEDILEFQELIGTTKKGQSLA